jgi:hypothetical protein
MCHLHRTTNELRVPRRVIVPRLLKSSHRLRRPPLAPERQHHVALHRQRPSVNEIPQHLRQLIKRRHVAITPRLNLINSQRVLDRHHQPSKRCRRPLLAASVSVPTRSHDPVTTGSNTTLQQQASIHHIDQRKDRAFLCEALRPKTGFEPASCATVSSDAALSN